MNFVPRISGDVLVDPSKIDHFKACLEALSEFEWPVCAGGFWFADDDPMSEYRPYRVEGGVLTIPVKGALLNGFPYAYGEVATGYEYIAAAIRRGVADSDVRGIALQIDSPGGMVAGNFDLADAIFAARERKPIRAYAAESAYSAAYSIASAADRVSVARTGGVGSIGVVTMHVDMSKALAEAGYEVTYIYAGKHKVEGNPFEPLGDDARARIQARIDNLYSIFVSTVARNRGLDEAAVRATEAATYGAEESVAKGLADEVGSFETAVAAFAAELSRGDTEEMPMAENMIPQADLEAAVAKAATDSKAAERARISGILNSEEAKARPGAAAHLALETDMTVAQATALLAKLPSETAATAPAGGLDQKMKQHATAPVGEGAAPAGKVEDGSSDLEIARALGVSGLKY
jgi:signal peptide peptidase SppA